MLDKSPFISRVEADTDTPVDAYSTAFMERLYDECSQRRQGLLCALAGGIVFVDEDLQAPGELNIFAAKDLRDVSLHKDGEFCELLFVYKDQRVRIGQIDSTQIEDILQASGLKDVVHHHNGPSTGESEAPCVRVLLQDGNWRVLTGRSIHDAPLIDFDRLDASETDVENDGLEDHLAAQALHAWAMSDDLGSSRTGSPPLPESRALAKAQPSMLLPRWLPGWLRDLRLRAALLAGILMTIGLGWLYGHVLPRQADYNHCSHAMIMASSSAWHEYLSVFPHGDCAQIGRRELDKLLVDQDTCHVLAADDSIESWEAYLEQFPWGVCEPLAHRRLSRLYAQAEEGLSWQILTHDGDSDASSDGSNTDYEHPVR